MVSTCSGNRSWKRIIFLYSSGNIENPVWWRVKSSPSIPVAVNWNVVVECKTLHLLFIVTFPNLQWKAMAQLSPGASLPELCLKKVKNENGKTHVCLPEIATKYMAAFLNDSDAPFRTATFCKHNLEGTFMTRWLGWLSHEWDPYLIAGSANLLFAEAELFL